MLRLLLCLSALVTLTGAAPETFNVSREFNISSCPIMFYQELYSQVFVNISSTELIVCFKGFYNSVTSNDCITGMSFTTGAVTFEIYQENYGIEELVKGEVPTITTSLNCFIYFDQFTSSPYAEVCPVNVIVEGRPVESFNISSGLAIKDISGCRVSGVGILPNSTFTPTNGSAVHCSVNGSVTSTGCGEQQRCDGSGLSSKSSVCTVTGPSVIDFKGHLTSVVDRCSYSLMSGPSNSFKVLATFQERRRRDVSFLDSLILQLDGSGVQFHLEQGGRVQLFFSPVQMNSTVLTLNSSVQQFHGVELSKDQTGVTATFLTSSQTVSVVFDGYTAQIHMEAPVGSSLSGLCVDSTDNSSVKVPQFSSSSCQTQYSDPVDSTVNCTVMTEGCNLLKAAPFSSCNHDVDPTPYIKACSDTLCRYPAVDGLRCQFLWAYSRTCSLNSSTTVGDWWSQAKCPPPAAFCQDKTCSDHEFCGEKLSGETGCLCRAVFSSKYKQANTLGDPPVCQQNSASLTLVGCLLEEKNINYSALHLKNQSCKGVMDEESHMVTFSFDTSNSCGAEILNNGSQIIYKNAIVKDNSTDVITRQDQVYIDFSCFESQPEMKVVAFRIKDSSVIQKISAGEWSYTLTMKTYSDADRTQALDSNTEVRLNQKVWVELKTDGLDGNSVAVVTDSCWATSQESPDSDPRYDLIKSGCSNPTDPTVQVEGNGQGTSNYFSFNMFQFSGNSDEVYLHCKLQLCLKNCVPDCGGPGERRRRSVRYRRGVPAFISLAWIH